MGRIKNFFNRIFGRNPKALNEAKEVTQGIPRDLPEEHNPRFQETLESQTIKPDELNIDGVVDLMVEEYGLENICKNARGRALIKENLETMMKDVYNGENRDVYSAKDIQRIFKEKLGEAATKGKISFPAQDQYLFQTRKDDFYTYDPGKNVVTLEATEDGTLTMTEKGRWEYDKTQYTPEVSYYEKSRTFENSGVETRRKDIRATFGQTKNQVGVSMNMKEVPQEFKEETECIREEGLRVRIISEKQGKTKFEENTINTEYGADDLSVSGGPNSPMGSHKSLQEFYNLSDEEFTKMVKSVVEQSKYKEGLTKMIPGAEDLSKNEVSMDIE